MTPGVVGGGHGVDLAAYMFSGIIHHLGAGFKNCFFDVHPDPWKNDPICIKMVEISTVLKSFGSGFAKTPGSQWVNDLFISIQFYSFLSRETVFNLHDFHF